MVASITAFNSVYNHCFHHEMDFLSFGTLVLYPRVGLQQYLIFHRLSLVYLVDKRKTFLRNFGIYQTTGCHTHKWAIFLLTTVINSELLQSFLNTILLVSFY